MTYKYIVLVLKSEKQHDAALQDLRDLGLEPEMLSPYERIRDSLEHAMIGYVTTNGFCSNGTLDDQQLAQSDVYVASTRKEFIQEVQKYLV
mgnify:CR=1 FL=1